MIGKGTRLISIISLGGIWGPRRHFSVLQHMRECSRWAPLLVLKLTVVYPYRTVDDLWSNSLTLSLNESMTPTRIKRRPLCQGPPKQILVWAFGRTPKGPPGKRSVGGLPKIVASLLVPFKPG